MHIPITAGKQTQPIRIVSWVQASGKRFSQWIIPKKFTRNGADVSQSRMCESMAASSPD